MARIKKDKFTRIKRDWTKARKLNAPTSLKDLMVRELPLSLYDSDIRELSVLTDPNNED